jgi:Cu/Zn superoxide dismutase
MRRDCARVSPGVPRALVAASVVCAVLTACSGLRPAAEPSSRVEARPAAAAGLEARLRPLGSGITGKVRVIDRGDGVTLLLSAINMPTGAYRIALHSNPNCSSPNGFSVGPAWAPAGTAGDPRQLVPVLYNNVDGAHEASIHLRGVRTSGVDGVAGRSVVIYSGNAVTDAVPDVPNNRLACGVFQPADTLRF